MQVSTPAVEVCKSSPRWEKTQEAVASMKVNPSAGHEVRCLLWIEEAVSLQRVAEPINNTLGGVAQ